MPPSKPHPSETIARKYLTQHGLKLIEQNYHSRYGEIDLIMQDQSTLVFIEVRQRSSQFFGAHWLALIYANSKKLFSPRSSIYPPAISTVPAGLMLSHWTKIIRLNG